MVERYLKEKKLFNIILMDMFMPVMDGYESAQNIRKLE
jgi:CheY-like chemotaxis protein